MQIQVRRLLLLSTMFGAISAIPVTGQTFGEITGRISDSTGAAISAAQITLTNVATNAVRSAASTDSGDYTFPAVAPGGYNIKVEKSAFKSASSTEVQVQIQQTIRLDFTLQVGQVSESIEVSASAQMLQAENVSLGTVIENKGVTELPLNGRNYLGLVALASNTNTLSPDVGASGWTPGWRPRQSVHLRRRQPNHVRLLHLGRRHEHGSGLQYLRRTSFDRRHPGVQGPDRRLSGRVRPPVVADQCIDQVWWKCLPRFALRVHP